ncbi:kelch motif domain-containing protein, putative [Eimeria mitis]|uniref:Kelch motif domain-containing protein, putative n=1 Tax=Eimeria mitis TaxID=44415 RepID=U6JUG0_9EIME|nr:kelch motif domain-containing protein, putative [Eimeria mitis]CDJ27163.1 kelch motif domain-containing protein, putative [Eimeria mitis]
MRALRNQSFEDGSSKGQHQEGATESCPKGTPTEKGRCEGAEKEAKESGDFLLFGGESYDGKKVRVYGDLFKWDMDKAEWRRLDAPEMPKARCSHQAVYHKWRKIEFPPHSHIPEARGGCVFVVVGDVILLHGGFAKIRDTNKRVQGKIFTDSWLLDLKPLAKGALTQIPTWEKIKNSGTPPSPRTGMCATAYKSTVIVFGGVADQDDGGTNLSSVFFNDMYSFDATKRRWYRLELKTGKKGGSRKRTPKQVEHDVGHLHLGEEERTCKSETSEESSDDEENWQNTFAYFDTKGRLVKLRLEDLPEVNRASATRSDATLRQSSPGCPNKPDGALSNHGSESSTYTSRAACDGPKDRTPSGTLAPTKPPEPTEPDRGAQHTDNKIAEAPQSAALAGPFEVSKTPSLFSADVPLPRLHGMICVRGSSLVLMGGLMELGSKEITLDDCWSLNMNKRDRWVRVLEGTMHEQEWQGAESEAESSGGSDSGDDSSNSDPGSSESDEDDDEVSSSDEEGPKHVTNKERKRYRVREEMQQLRERYGLDDPMETPAEGESLRDFFERTKEYWVQKARAGGCSAKNNKEMTREAFEAASARVSAIREALRRMDELQRLDGDQSEERESRPHGNPKASTARNLT